MDNATIGMLVALVSLVVSLAVYPLVMKYARTHGIVDNPNAR